MCFLSYIIKMCSSSPHSHSHSILQILRCREEGAWEARTNARGGGQGVRRWAAQRGEEHAQGREIRQEGRAARAEEVLVREIPLVPFV